MLQEDMPDPIWDSVAEHLLDVMRQHPGTEFIEVTSAKLTPQGLVIKSRWRVPKSKSNGRKPPLDDRQA